VSGGSTGTAGRGFWLSVVVGAVLIGVGVWTAFTYAGGVHPPEFAAFVIGAVLLHDLVLVPVTLAVGTLVVRRAPRVTRAVGSGAIAATALLTAFALPVVLRWGAQPDNPSMLPRSGTVGLLVSLAVVWIVAAWLLVRRTRGR
jgi:amino acid transporter